MKIHKILTILRIWMALIKNSTELVERLNQTHPYQTELNYTKPNSSIPNQTQPHQRSSAIQNVTIADSS